MLAVPPYASLEWMLYVLDCLDCETEDSDEVLYLVQRIEDAQFDADLQQGWRYDDDPAYERY